MMHTLGLPFVFNTLSPDPAQCLVTHLLVQGQRARIPFHSHAASAAARREAAADALFAWAAVLHLPAGTLPLLDAAQAPAAMPDATLARWQHARAIRLQLDCAIGWSLAPSSALHALRELAAAALVHCDLIDAYVAAQAHADAVPPNVAADAPGHVQRTLHALVRHAEHRFATATALQAQPPSTPAVATLLAQACALAAPAPAFTAAQQAVHREHARATLEALRAAEAEAAAHAPPHSRADRLDDATLNPGAHAFDFVLFLDCLFFAVERACPRIAARTACIFLCASQLLGWSTKFGRPRAKPGVFGFTRAWFGAVQQQQRLVLHIHLLIWIFGYETTMAFLATAAGRTALQVFLDALLSSHPPLPPWESAMALCCDNGACRGANADDAADHAPRVTLDAVLDLESQRGPLPLPAHQRNRPLLRCFTCGREYSGEERCRQAIAAGWQRRAFEGEPPLSREALDNALLDGSLLRRIAGTADAAERDLLLACFVLQINHHAHTFTCLKHGWPTCRAHFPIAARAATTVEVDLRDRTREHLRLAVQFLVSAQDEEVVRAQQRLATAEARFNAHVNALASAAPPSADGTALAAPSTPAVAAALASPAVPTLAANANAVRAVAANALVAAFADVQHLTELPTYTAQRLPSDANAPLAHWQGATAARLEAELGAGANASAGSLALLRHLTVSALLHNDLVAAHAAAQQQLIAAAAAASEAPRTAAHHTLRNATDALECYARQRAAPAQHLLASSADASQPAWLATELRLASNAAVPAPAEQQQAHLQALLGALRDAQAFATPAPPPATAADLLTLVSTARTEVHEHTQRLLLLQSVAQPVVAAHRAHVQLFHLQALALDMQQRAVLAEERAALADHVANDTQQAEQKTCAIHARAEANAALRAQRTIASRVEQRLADVAAADRASAVAMQRLPPPPDHGSSPTPPFAPPVQQPRYLLHLRRRADALWSVDCCPLQGLACCCNTHTAIVYDTKRTWNAPRSARTFAHAFVQKRSTCVAI